MLWLHRRNQGIFNDPKSDAATLAAANRLSRSILAFRNVVDANSRFTIYKTLVGFDFVFPPAWDDDNFDPAEEDAYRKERIDELVAQVNAQNSDEWFVIIQRCAQTESMIARPFRASVCSSKSSARPSRRSSWTSSTSAT